ncbi:MAG: carboxymuconolactone decarboxylase family protein [Alphaproteobacteria bacterium]
MSRIEPLPEEELSEFAEFFEPVEKAMGFKPTANMIMARCPDVLRHVGRLAIVIMCEDGTIGLPLKWMIAHLASLSAGCRYCTAHTLSNGYDFGVPMEKVDAIWDYERSDLFSEGERAALAFAQVASMTPSGATDAHFAELRKHWSDNQIVEMVTVVSFFGFMNRFNDNLDVTLEDKPMQFALDHGLDKHGWTPADA